MKILGVIVNDSLKWSSHVSATCVKACRRLHILRRLKLTLSQSELHLVYTLLIRSLLEYASPAFVGINKALQNKIQRVDNRAHRLIYNIYFGSDNVRKCLCE